MNKILVQIGYNTYVEVPADLLDKLLKCPILDENYLTEAGGYRYSKTTDTIKVKVINTEESYDSLNEVVKKQLKKIDELNSRIETLGGNLDDI